MWEERQEVVIWKRKEGGTILKYSDWNTQTTEVSRVYSLLEFLFYSLHFGSYQPSKPKEDHLITVVVTVLLLGIIFTED